MKVLILAGGFDQIRLIEEYKKRGDETILIDYYENPPAKPFVKKHYQISTLDVEAVKKIAIDEKVDLISTACTDQALLTMAQISEELGLPCYLTQQTALEVTNKEFMKEKMLKNHIPTAKFHVIKDVREFDLQDMNLPLVVKPVDANSSKGITKVEDIGKLQEAVKNAKEYSRENGVIVEEYKEGDELSVDAWVLKGEVKILCISSSVKLKENENNFTIVQSQYPYSLTNEEEKNIKNTLQRIADCFGLENSPLLVQMIKGKNEINVIEFSARMGGGSKYKLIEKASGVDVIQAFVDLSLNISPRIIATQSENYIHMNYDYCYSGKIKCFQGFDVMKEEGLIDEYFMYKTPGMTVCKADNSSDRVSGYLILAGTLEEICEKERKVESELRVIDTNGKNIRRKLLG